MLNVLNKKTLAINLILGIILGVVMYIIPLRYVEAIPTAHVTNPTDITGYILSDNVKSQVALLMLFSAVGGLVLLILNRRLALTVAGGTYFLILLGFLILNKGSKDLILSYQIFRNVAFVVLILYLAAHLSVHSIAWFLKRKRKILTIWGVVNFFILFLLFTFAYAIAYIFPAF